MNYYLEVISFRCKKIIKNSLFIGFLFHLSLLLINSYSKFSEAGDITQTFVEIIKKKNQNIKSYIAYCKYYEVSSKKWISTERLIWKGKDKVLLETEKRDGRKILIGFDGKDRWIKGARFAPSNVILKSKFSEIINEYGKIAKHVLPHDLRKPFEWVVPGTLEYIGIEKIKEKNTWTKYVYKFEAQKEFLNLSKRELNKQEFSIFIDTESGLIYKIIWNGEIMRVDEVEINPEINDSIFEYKLKEGEEFKDVTGYWRSLFEELSGLNESKY